MIGFKHKWTASVDFFQRLLPELRCNDSFQDGSISSWSDQIRFVPILLYVVLGALFEILFLLVVMFVILYSLVCIINLLSSFISLFFAVFCCCISICLCILPFGLCWFRLGLLHLPALFCSTLLYSVVTTLSHFSLLLCPFSCVSLLRWSRLLLRGLMKQTCASCWFDSSFIYWFDSNGECWWVLQLFWCVLLSVAVF